VRPEDPFEDFIAKPPVRKVGEPEGEPTGSRNRQAPSTPGVCELGWSVNDAAPLPLSSPSLLSSPLPQLVHDKEINAEDEQVFLMKQQVCMCVCV